MSVVSDLVCKILFEVLNFPSTNEIDGSFATRLAFILLAIKPAPICTYVYTDSDTHTHTHTDQYGQSAPLQIWKEHEVMVQNHSICLHCVTSDCHLKNRRLMAVFPEHWNSEFI